MDGHKVYYAKWNKSGNERQITYGFTYMCYVQNKTNEQTNKQNRNRLINTEKRLVVDKGEGSRGLGEIGDTDK